MESRNIISSTEPIDIALIKPERLTINLLGGMELKMGSKTYDHPFLHRKKVKTLLSYLVLSEGREINTERLQSILWPTSPLSKNRNNFNNLWSLLRKGLTPDGSEVCPYIQRHQGVCKLNRTVVDSDLFELHSLCDEFQFAEAEPAEALELYHRLRSVYRGNLLPGDEGNPIIMRSRRMWRDRTVDALYMMALSLKRRGALQETLWFTDAALSIDETREDVLRLEMRTHLDRGNPSRALASYVQAGTVLDQRYGLQPHAETAALASEALGGALPPRIPRITCIPVRETSSKRKTTVRRKASVGRPKRTVEASARLASGDLPQRSAR